MLATAPHTSSPSTELPNLGVAQETIAGFRSVLSSQALLSQLRQTYPTGCLLSELVQIHSDQFIVRSIVQIEGQTVTTALASAATIEAAEDRARIRVLASLGISASAGYVAALPTAEMAPSRSVSVTPASVTTATPEASPESSPQISLEKTPLEKLTTPKTRTIASAPVAPAPVETPIAAVPEPILESPIEAAIEPAVEISGGDDLEVEIEYEFTIEDEADLPEEPPVAAPEPPMDLSDAIAQIGAEIDRIGWTKKQGSTYLQQTYGKRTRAELTETELFAFLKYLQSLPSKLQVPLSQLPF